MTMANMMLSPLRYRFDVILRDATYGLVGIAILLWIGFGVFGSDVSISTLSDIGLVVVALGLFVCGYLLSIAGLRAATHVTVTPLDLTIESLFPKTLTWTSLNSLVLRYYSTRRDRSNGWYKLTLAANGNAITLTSDLDGFESILLQAFKCARHHSVAMDGSTLSNLTAFGIKHDGIGVSVT